MSSSDEQLPLFPRSGPPKHQPDGPDNTSQIGKAEQLTFGQVVAYIKRKYGMTVTRQSIYNWTNPSMGVNDEHLKFQSITSPTPTNPNRVLKVTTESEVDTFLMRSSLGTIQPVT
jgi:hypothetical protein